ncbi:unnamed protein product [Peronospora destructor]|uniref:Uncharacterized protein n=1 Tax=Peronospora destructor TaxID=86335 RepID=A0AAV0T4C0_9STRA|nr:unnamed protein product [Peronospora destructor]
MVVTEATDKYIATMKKEANLDVSKVKVTVNKIVDGMLPDAKAGGVVLYAKQGKIVCDNTLETRLDQICYDLKPNGVLISEMEPMSKEQAKKALERSAAIRASHFAAKSDFPSRAGHNVLQLSSDELQQNEAILNEETTDYISGKNDVPARLNTPMMQRLQAYCRSSSLGKAPIEEFAQNMSN